MAKSTYDSKYEKKLFTLIDFEAIRGINDKLENQFLSEEFYLSIIDIERYENLTIQAYDEFRYELTQFVERNGAGQTSIIISRLYNIFNEKKLSYESSGIIDVLRNNYYSCIFKEDTNQSENARYSKLVRRFKWQVAELNNQSIQAGLMDLEQLAQSKDVSWEEIVKKNASVGDEISIGGKADEVCKYKDLLNQFVNNPKYVFDIKPKKAGQNTTLYLERIHGRLKDAKYIECNKTAFIKIFNGKDPKPAKWLKSYAHLSYFILRLKEDFYLVPGSISAYKVAVRFFIDENGEYFCRHRYNCDDKPNQHDILAIDEIIGINVRIKRD